MSKLPVGTLLGAGQHHRCYFGRDRALLQPGRLLRKDPGRALVLVKDEDASITQSATYTALNA